MIPFSFSPCFSFGDISNNSIFHDMDKLIMGVAIMVIYVQFVISKFNWLEARVLSYIRDFDKEFIHI